MSKVLIISNIPSPYRAALFSYLQSAVAEHTFHVLYTSDNEGDRAWQIDPGSLKNTIILKSRVLQVKGGDIGGTAVRFIHLPPNLGKTLSEINPDVIIGSEYNPSAVQALLWAKLHRKKFINLTDGTLRSETYIGGVQKLTRKLIISSADAFLASSTKAKEKLLHWGAAEEKIFLSYLTVDIEPFLHIPREPEVGRLLYVGRISREKGVDLLLDALAKVKTEVSLRIVGNDVNGEMEKLKAQAERLGIAHRVVWCGYQEGAALFAEYSKAAALVVPSRSDCFGLVMLEALCAELPIVASRYADGAYDLICEGANGSIADPENAGEFAAAIDRVLSAGEADEEYCKAAAEKFHFGSVARGYVDAITWALRHKPSRRKL